jgi:hypothetical protein
LRFWHFYTFFFNKFLLNVLLSGRLQAPLLSISADSISQGSVTDSQYFCGFGLVAIGLVERLQDCSSFYLFEWYACESGVLIGIWLGVFCLFGEAVLFLLREWLQLIEKPRDVCQRQYGAESQY